jgi:hypothetical protein
MIARLGLYFPERRCRVRPFTVQYLILLDKNHLEEYLLIVLNVNLVAGAS